MFYFSAKNYHSHITFNFTLAYVYLYIFHGMANYS